MTNLLYETLWAAQVCLCSVFIFAGALKLTETPQGLAEMGRAWSEAMPPRFTPVVGITELLGANGIVLLALTQIKLFLVPLAAIGFAALQVSAIVLHASRGELSKTLWFNFCFSQHPYLQRGDAGNLSLNQDRRICRRGSDRDYGLVAAR